jgi:DMSO reductase anchor subunit
MIVKIAQMIEIEAPLAIQIMFFFCLVFVIGVIIEVHFLYPMRAKKRKALQQLKDKR